MFTLCMSRDHPPLQDAHNHNNSGFFCQRWREEWFILYEDSTLEWYAEKGLRKPRGRLRIGDAPELLAVGEWTCKVPKRPPLPHDCHMGQFLAIGSKVSRNIQWLMAQSPGEVNDWMTAISNTLPPPPNLQLENNYIYLPAKQVNIQQQRNACTASNGSCHKMTAPSTNKCPAIATPSPPASIKNFNSYDADHTVLSGVVIDWGHGWGWGHNAWTLHSGLGAGHSCATEAMNTAFHCHSLGDYATDGFDEVDCSAFGDFAF